MDNLEVNHKIQYFEKEKCCKPDRIDSQLCQYYHSSNSSDRGGHWQILAIKTHKSESSPHGDICRLRWGFFWRCFSIPLGLLADDDCPHTQLQVASC